MHNMYLSYTYLDSTGFCEAQQHDRRGNGRSQVTVVTIQGSIK